MKRKIFKFVSLLVILAITFVTLTGCGLKDQAKSKAVTVIKEDTLLVDGETLSIGSIQTDTPEALIEVIEALCESGVYIIDNEIYLDSDHKTLLSDEIFNTGMVRSYWK